MNLFDRNYDVTIDVHGYVNWIVGPTSPALMEVYTGQKVSNAKKNDHKQWTNSLKKNLSFLEGYEYKSAGGLGDGGAFEDYAYWDKCEAFCRNTQTRKRSYKNKLSEYHKYRNLHS